MSLPETLTEAYLFPSAQAVLAGELSLEEASAKLISIAEWGNPSDGVINRVDTLIQDLIYSQRNLQFAYILAELNLAVCEAVGSPSQQVLCANTVGEAITALKDHRLTPRRIEVYEAALDILAISGDEWRSAILHNNLGNAYSELTTGDTQINLQKAIEHYEQALAVFTFQTQPYAWASIQNNLGTLYKSKTGADGETTYPAIDCWKRALSVFDRETYPYEWANVQRNLGIAHKDLNTGNPVENLTLARDHLLAALEVVIPEAQPVTWAEVQNALGNVYFRLTTGSRSENLQHAIACFEQALTMRTIEEFPVQFAMTCANLGNVWFSMPSGNQIDNLRRAIKYYEQALTIYTPEDFPELNAQIHTNLAGAFFQLPAGDRARNLYRAEQSLNMVLKVFTQAKHPTRYAWVKTTQGAIYQAMARNDPAFALRAISSFQAALTVYTAEAFPEDYARSMDVLGTIYRTLTEGDAKENHRQAERCYLEALTIYHSENYPDEYASTQTNLGNCYLFWPDPDRSQTIPKAISCFQESLRFHARDTTPLSYAKAMDGLAIAYSLLADQKEEFREAASRCFQEAVGTITQIGAKSELARIAGNAGSFLWKQGNWASAYPFLEVAIDTVEAMWSEHYSPLGKSELQLEHANLYSRVVQTCQALGRYRETFNYIERSRSRSLLSLLGQTLQSPGMTKKPLQDKLEKISSLSDDLRTLENVMSQTSSAEEILALIDQENRLRRELDGLFNETASSLPEYVALRRGQPIDFETVKAGLQL